MALVLLDGCEDQSSLLTSGGTPTIIAGRYQNCIGFTTSASVQYVLQTAQETDTLTVGFAFRAPTIAAGSILEFRSDAAATEHVRLSLLANGGMTVGRATTVLFTSATGLIVANTWNYIELQAKLADTVAPVTLKLNGATLTLGATYDTKNAGTKTVFDAIRFTGIASTGSQLDDVYIESGAGDPFLGAITIETLLPNGNGDVNQWTGIDGDSVDNYQQVDEPTSPFSNDYVYSTTVGHQDLYTLSDLAHTTGTIVGVCHSALMLRTDTGTAMSVKLVNRRAADTKSASLPINATAYRSYDYCLTTDPEGGGAFTIANVNALQTGVELA